MSTVESRSDVNLGQLRTQLAGQVAVLIVYAGGLLGLLLLRQDPFPVVLEAILIVLVGLGLVVRKLIDRDPCLARHLLVWGLAIAMLNGMVIFPDVWVPFLGLGLGFLGALLVPGSEFVATGATAALAAWLAVGGDRAYPLPALLTTLACGTGLGWLVVHTLYTGLDWAWTAQQRSEELLETSRDSRSELSRALHSLEITNWVLRRNQQELAEARRQAQEARETKERFAANVSHELRTPLNVILGFSEVMYVSPEVYGPLEWPPALREDAYQIYSNSRHLMEMIDDVLDLSRLEIAGFTLDKEPTPLNWLLGESAEMIADLFRVNSTRLEVDLAQDLPTLEIDRTRIRQVVLNLLNNAVRFAPHGVVRLKATREDGHVAITVEDDGPGIAADRQVHLFDEFYQADRSLDRRHGGVGLGLAISKHFVDAHDGHMWVESELGKGATFGFALPIPGAYAPLSRLLVDEPIVPRHTDGAPPILVVDPDPRVGDIVRRHLCEHDVVWVERAERLGEVASLHHPRAVVYNVPPGKQWASEDMLPEPVPLIQCSLPSQQWLADDLAVSACLTKPVSVQELRGVIDHAGTVTDILVVDDDWSFCQLVARILETMELSFRVRLANGGLEGLAALRDNPPDLLLLDLAMPGADGFHVLEEMRADPRLAHVPVVLLTATSYVEDALMRLSSQIVIQRTGGLSPGEILSCLKAVVGALEPRYGAGVALRRGTQATLAAEPS